MNTPVRTTDRLALVSLHDGALWHVRLDAPPGNVLDAELLGGLTDVFAAAARERSLKAVILEGRGAHLSFGASVAEHLPGSVEAMLAGMQALFEALFAACVPTLAVVRGQCLGGGLELVSACTRIFAAPDARLGQPEIVLGVFAPVAHVLLPGRVGRSVTEDLCLTGRVVKAQEALALGLVDELADDPGQAAHTWVERHLLPRSASSLRLATRAVQLEMMRDFPARLESQTRLYLDELMATRDAVEGLTAFLEKRPPVWSDS